MPYLPTAQSWLEQATLLLKARPTTTHITTKYTILSASASSKISRRPKKHTDAPETSSSVPQPEEGAVKATLTLKAYDPTSGTTLKYATTKAQEVGRLIQILGRLARPMAGLEEREDVKMEGAEVEKEEIKMEVVVKKEEIKAMQAGAGGGGGKGKKKKGKK